MTGTRRAFLVRALTLGTVFLPNWLYPRRAATQATVPSGTPLLSRRQSASQATVRRSNAVTFVVRAA